MVVAQGIVIYGLVCATTELNYIFTSRPIS